MRSSWWIQKFQTSSYECNIIAAVILASAEFVYSGWRQIFMYNAPSIFCIRKANTPSAGYNPRGIARNVHLSHPEARELGKNVVCFFNLYNGRVAREQGLEITIESAKQLSLPYLGFTLTPIHYSKFNNLVFGSLWLQFTNIILFINLIK